MQDLIHTHSSVQIPAEPKLHFQLQQDIHIHLRTYMCPSLIACCPHRAISSYHLHNYIRTIKYMEWNDYVSYPGLAGDQPCIQFPDPGYPGYPGYCFTADIRIQDFQTGGLEQTVVECQWQMMDIMSHLTLHIPTPPESACRISLQNDLGSYNMSLGSYDVTTSMG